MKDVRITEELAQHFMDKLHSERKRYEELAETGRQTVRHAAKAMLSETLFDLDTLASAVQDARVRRDGDRSRFF